MKTIEEIQKELEEEKLKKTRPERIKKMIKNIFIDIVVIAVILFLVVTGVSMWDRLNWRQFSASGMFVSFILTCLIAAIYFIVKYVWFDFMEYLFIFGIIVILSCIEYEAILFFVYGVFDEIISRWAFIPCLLITTAAMTIFQTLKEEKL